MTSVHPDRRSLELIDEWPLGYVRADGDGVIDWANSTILEWLGTSLDELVGSRSLQDLFTGGGRIYYDTHIRPLLDLRNDVREVALELAGVDGTRVSVLFNALRRTDPDGTTTIDAIFFDAGERRRYERELLRERQKLEQSESRLRQQYDLLAALATALSVDDVIEVFGSTTGGSAGVERATIWLLDDDEHAVTSQGPDPRSVDVPDTSEAFDELRAGNLIVINDCVELAGRYPIICAWMAERDRQAAVLAPLIVRGRLRGALTYAFSDATDFDTATLDSFASMARHAEQALGRAWLHEAERRTRSRLVGLFEFTARLADAITLDEVFQVLGGSGMDLLDAAGTRIAMLDPAPTTVRFAHAAGVGGAATTTLPIGSRSIACESIRTGETIVTPDRETLAEQFPDSPILDEQAFGRVISSPLTRDDMVLGAWVLAFADAGDPVDDDLRMVRLFAEQAGLAARRAASHEAEVEARRQSDLRRTISEALNRAFTAREVGHVLSTEAGRAFDADGIAVFAVDDADQTQLDLVASMGLAPDVAVRLGALQVSSRVIARTFDSLTPVFLRDLDLVVESFPQGADGDWQAAAVLPLVDAGRAIGLIIVLFAQPDRLDAATEVALSGMAAEASVAVGRARSYEVEHRVAMTLQRSMLPARLPDVDGWTIDSCYLPGSQHMVVGGDLFDLTVRSDGSMVIVVGDLVGHGLAAAAAMGQLRSAARALGLVMPTPGTLLDRLDEVARLTPGGRYASLCCVMLDRDGRGRYAAAGHPYPILVAPDRSTDILADGRSSLLGLGVDGRQDAEIEIEPGASLVLYTDGLVELRGESIDAGIERLRRHLETVDFAADDGRRSARSVADAVTDHSDGPTDDVVLVVVTRQHS